MIKQLDKYIEALKHELEQHSEDFVGCVSFQFNLKHRTIGNMNVDMKKSIKISEE